MKYIGFKNGYYKDNWRHGAGYEDGSAYANEDDSWNVYDGKQNWMGRIEADGSFTFNGTKSEYKESFLRAAADALK